MVEVLNNVIKQGENVGSINNGKMILTQKIQNDQ